MNPAASTDGGEEAWVELESAPTEEPGAWAPRGMCDRVKRWAKTAAVPARMLAACDVAELPTADEVVQVYDARTGEWAEEVGAELEVGDTFVDDGRVLRLTEDGLEVRGGAEVEDLAEADATWVAEAAHQVPGGDDWVLVLGEGDDAGHWRLSDVAPGERLAFQGRVFDTADVDADGALEVRATEQVLSRVVETFVRQSDTVIDAEIAYDDGTVEVITGTPEHPFWVPKLQEWVPLGELVEGTELHVDSGAGAILVSSTWRQGDFTVYNFEVEGTHNYFVRAQGSDAPAVLVHNNCIKRAGEIMSSLPGAGKLFTCDQCAAGLRSALKSEGISGTTLRVQARNADGSRSLANVWSDNAGANIAENGFHEAIQVGDTVFDNMNPGGIAREAWEADLHTLPGVALDIAEEAF